MAMMGEPPGVAPPTPEPVGAAAPLMPRETPVVDPARKAQVKWWQERVLHAKEHYKKPFDRMKDNHDFVHGWQWSKQSDDDRYVVNITLRHVLQKTADIYAKNPKAIAKRRPRVLNTVWDGSSEQLQQAQVAMMNALALAAGGGAGGGVPGGPPPGAGPMPMGGDMPSVPPGMGPPNMGGPPGMSPPGMGGGATPMLDTLAGGASAAAAAIVMDAQKVKLYNQQMDRIARTMELLYDYNIDEQPLNFKKMLKTLVRRSFIATVSYIKLTFQRTMGKSPEIMRQITDTARQLATLQRLVQDRADGQFTNDDQQMSQLALVLKSLQNEPEIVLREGLLLDYPLSNAIIPDPKCKLLSGFVGCEWVAEEFMLSPAEIKEIYEKDVTGSFSAFSRDDKGQDLSTYEAIKRGEHPANPMTNKDQGTVARVWEIWCKKDGLVYVICEGYPDYLREPSVPEFYTDRFWPWFAFVPNETTHPEQVYPPSDVDLLRFPQMEINRARQGLREHRRYNRPKTITAPGALDQEDQEKLSASIAHSIIEINALQPGQKIEDVLQPWRGSPIDPNFYEVQGSFEDIQRSVGTQEATLGGVSGGTATEANIAQSAMSTASSSNVNDLDELLNELARAASQILLLNVSEQTVKKIVGDGAMWPAVTKADVASEIWLEVQAGSSGRPNQAVEIQNFERLAPFLLQTPRIKPEFIIREAIKRLDDTIDPTEVIAEGAPSIVQQNAMKSPMGSASPGMQGPAGAAGGSGTPAPPPPDSRQPSAIGAGDKASPPPGGQDVAF